MCPCVGVVVPVCRCLHPLSENQFVRRASIAAARNHLLHLALRPRHTAVVWLDSDLWSFPADSLLLLQQTGACVRAGVRCCNAQ